MHRTVQNLDVSEIWLKHSIWARPSTILKNDCVTKIFSVRYLSCHCIQSTSLQRLHNLNKTWKTPTIVYNTFSRQTFFLLSINTRKTFKRMKVNMRVGTLLPPTTPLTRLTPKTPLADLEGACRAHALPYGTQFFHFRTHFYRKVPVSEVHTPNGYMPPPMGNPGSATELCIPGVDPGCSRGLGPPYHQK